jgi:hypothetical protein
MFCIGFTLDAAIEWHEEPARRGEIVLGSFREEFLAPLVYWSEEDYVRQWRRGVRRILNGHERSCLMVRMYDPSAANILEWWPMYRVADENILVTDALLFLDQLASPLSADDPYPHIRDFSALSENGEPISSWHVTPKDLEDYLGNAPHNKE